MPLCRHLAALHPRACRPCVLNGCPPPPQPVQARWAAAEFPPAPPLDGYPRSARPASRPVRRQVLPRVRHPARPVAAAAAAWTRAAGSRRASACPTQTLSGKHQRGGGRAARAVESTRSACDLAYCDGVSCGLSARISATSAHEDRAIVACGLRASRTRLLRNMLRLQVAEWRALPPSACACRRNLTTALAPTPAGGVWTWAGQVREDDCGDQRRPGRQRRAPAD